MKYADHARISSILRGFFGDVKVLDGANREYTDVNVTGDTGTIWSLPELPSHRSIEDIADSILLVIRLRCAIVSVLALWMTVLVPHDCRPFAACSMSISNLSRTRLARCMYFVLARRPDGWTSL
jgi:hypothetical protein